MKFVLKEAWDRHRAGFTQEWMDISEDPEVAKMHLRASASFIIPNSPEDPRGVDENKRVVDMSEFCKKAPELTVSRLLGKGLPDLMTKYAETPLERLHAMDVEHVLAQGLLGINQAWLRTSVIYSTLLSQIDWYYDIFLPYKNVDALSVLLEGPEECTHLGEREMRHRSLREQEITAEAKARRDREFDAKYKPKLRLTRKAPRPSAAAEPEPEPEPERDAEEERQSRLAEQVELERRDVRRNQAVQDAYDSLRISPKGINSLFKLRDAVLELGWQEKPAGSGHIIFTRTFTTARCCGGSVCGTEAFNLYRITSLGDSASTLRV